MTPDGGMVKRQTLNRRRWVRVKLAAPVHLSKGTAQEGPVAGHAGWSTDLSPGGVYLTTKGRGAVTSGETVTVSIEIPWEARGRFPFSRIMGPCRVVRVDEIAGSQDPMTGLALELREHDATLLGSIVDPQ